MGCIGDFASAGFVTKNTDKNRARTYLHLLRTKHIEELWPRESLHGKGQYHYKSIAIYYRPKNPFMLPVDEATIILIHLDGLTPPLKPRVMVNPQKLSRVATPNSSSPLNTPVSGSKFHVKSGGEDNVSPIGGGTGANVGAGGSVAIADGPGVGEEVSAITTPAVMETESTAV